MGAPSRAKLVGEAVQAPVCPEGFTGLRWRVSFAVAAVLTQAADWLTGPRLTGYAMVV